MKKPMRKKISVSELSSSEVGIRISFIRLSCGKTLEEFSEQIGISKGNLSDLENNKNKPSYNVIIEIMEKFGVCSEWLLLGKGFPFRTAGSEGCMKINEEMVDYFLSNFFDQKEKASRVFAMAAMIERVYPDILAELDEHISEKYRDKILQSERRNSDRRKKPLSGESAQSMERRAGIDRRIHNLYRWLKK